MAGEHQCLAGVGSGSDFGTFPSHWEVNQLITEYGGMDKSYRLPGGGLGATERTILGDPQRLH